jgi:prepilin-type N-terminal cleavage/methylation domain-containing protein
MSENSHRGNNSGRAGFTLVEMLISLFILGVVLSVALGYVVRLQRVYGREETKVDATVTARTLLDGLQRELHQAGFPGGRLYGPGVLSTPAANDPRKAVGLVRVSSSDLWFESDIDNDNQVDSVRYTLMNSSGTPAEGGGTCPCTLRRSQVLKQNGSPLAQALVYIDALPNVINSGVGQGGGALPISGTTGSVSNDVLYAAYKAPPVFSAFDQNGNAIGLPVDLNSNPTAVARITNIVININTLTARADGQTRQRIPLSMKLAADVHSY